MSASPGISRRRFLAALGCAGMSLLCVPGYRSQKLLGDVSASHLGARLAGVFTHSESAHTVGLQYLRTAHGERDLNTLIRLIASILPGGHRALVVSNDADLRHLLGMQVRRDFEEERTVKLDGWILSLTEARLCAIATLV